MTNRVAEYGGLPTVSAPCPDYMQGMPMIQTATDLYGTVQRQDAFAEQYRKALLLATLMPDPRQKAELN